MPRQRGRDGKPLVRSLLQTRAPKVGAPKVLVYCMVWVYLFFYRGGKPTEYMHVRLMCEVLIACVQPLACPSLWFPLTIACVSARKLSGSTFNLVLRHIPMLQHGGILQWEGSSQCSFQGGWIFSGKLRLFVQREGNGFSFPWRVWVSVSVFHCGFQKFKLP